MALGMFTKLNTHTNMKTKRNPNEWTVQIKPPAVNNTAQSSNDE